jgi:beta-glucosidase
VETDCAIFKIEMKGKWGFTHMISCKSFRQALALFTTTMLFAIPSAQGQASLRPWMNKSLPAGERADHALKQMTLDEKLELLHGNGMAGASNWQMPLTHLANGGAGYVAGVPRFGIPPIIMSDAAYGVRASGSNRRYSTALPSDIALASKLGS